MITLKRREGGKRFPPSAFCSPIVLLERGDNRRLVVELHHERGARTFDLRGSRGTDGHNVETVLFQEAGDRRLDLVRVIGTILEAKDRCVCLGGSTENSLFHLVHFTGRLDLVRQTLRLRDLFGLGRLFGIRRRLDGLPLHQGGEVLLNLIDDGIAGFDRRIVHERAHTAVR